MGETKQDLIYVEPKLTIFDRLKMLWQYEVFKKEGYTEEFLEKAQQKSNTSSIRAKDSSAAPLQFFDKLSKNGFVTEYYDIGTINGRKIAIAKSPTGNKCYLYLD